MKLSYLKAFSAALLALCVLSGCGLVTGNTEQPETESETAVTSRKYVSTTKTASRNAEADADDEDIGGYTTTSAVTGGTLENPYSEDDEPDPDILATLSTTTTLYTIPEGAEIITSEKKTKKTTKKTASQTKTTTTAFTADKLYKPLAEDKFKVKHKYLVVSDTTYLNLRFGPSKEYEIQLKIPDGEYIYGTAQTSNPNNEDEKWVYVTYNGTSGWVMRGLLEETD
ncbi:SH3 domain-containing protein [Ruminococcus sp. Marseille-P6503]|uniref:SH3 domain-containing protein n=1 Tax=Ruminococcus sp. Marseille-P6503 TaxID=2364796 RepID=UPI000F533109|nr:SH3 domain-containing protein [Ruminococcus sp. Marseille-P6503]